jgi:hypothetical protein
MATLSIDIIIFYFFPRIGRYGNVEVLTFSLVVGVDM